MKSSNIQSMVFLIAMLMLLDTTVLAAENNKTLSALHDLSNSASQDISASGELALQSIMEEIHLQSHIDLQASFINLQLQLAKQMANSVDLVWQLNTEATLPLPGADHSLARNK